MHLTSKFNKGFRFSLFDLYLKSGTLLLADVFEKLRKMYLEIYQLNPAKFLSVPRLAW